MNHVAPDIQPNDLPWARQIMTHALTLLQRRNDPETGEYRQSEDDDIYAISPYICDNIRQRWELKEIMPQEQLRVGRLLRYWISELLSAEYSVERWLVKRVPAAAELRQSDPDLFDCQLALYRQRWLAALIEQISA